MTGLQGGDWNRNKDAFLEAIVGAGVKVILFGTNHYITNYTDNKTNSPKVPHFEEAKSKVIGISFLMMEQTFFE